MAIQVHELEGVLFRNEGTYRGAFMVNGMTYEIVGTLGNKAGNEYIQLRAQPRKAAEVRPVQARPLPRGEKLRRAMNENQKKYQGLGWK